MTAVRLAITMATNHNVSVSVLLLAMVQFAHDREVVRSYVEAGAIPAESVCLDTALGMLDWDDLVALMTEGGEMSQDIKYEVGMDCVGYDHKMSVVRQIRDVLDNSVLALYGKDDDVTAWADSLGGLRAVQEDLCGVSLKKDMWYATTCRELFLERGYHVKPLGEAQMEYEVEGATSHTSYAVEAHRLVVNRKAHGEVVDDDDTTPNWALSEFDRPISDKPYWWNGIALGRFNDNLWEKKLSKTADGHYRLKQVETRKSPNWLPDIRVSKIPDASISGIEVDPIDVIGSVFKRITAFAPWWAMQDNDTVKEFTTRFYNHPETLLRKKVGDGDKARWAFGMLTPKGSVMWAPVTRKASQKIDWQIRVAGGEKWEPKKLRAIYIKQWVVTYRKDGDYILATKMKSNSFTGTWEVWKESKLEFRAWGKTKRELLALGGSDAYLGYPWRLYEAPVGTKPVFQGKVEL